MSEEPKDVKDVEEKTTEKVDTPTESNRDWKDNPNTQKLTSEINTLRAELEAFKAVSKKDEQEKAVKDAESKQEYDKALELVNKEKAALAKEHESYKLQNEVALEVLALNAPKEVADLALAQYQQLPKEGQPPVKEFVKSFSEHPVYSALFGAGVASEKQTATNTGTVSGGSAMSAKKADAMAKSNDPKQRAMGRQYLRDYFMEHGKLPD